MSGRLLVRQWHIVAIIPWQLLPRDLFVFVGYLDSICTCMYDLVEFATISKYQFWFWAEISLISPCPSPRSCPAGSTSSECACSTLWTPRRSWQLEIQGPEEGLGISFCPWASLRELLPAQRANNKCQLLNDFHLSHPCSHFVWSAQDLTRFQVESNSQVN